MIALYVYSSTTFETDSAIESMDGTLFKGDEVTLEPGVYRLKDGATITGAKESSATNFDIVPFGTKTKWPDPSLLAVPDRAVELLHTSADAIKIFLEDAGSVTPL
jgi:hypothetical protein